MIKIRNGGKIVRVTENELDKYLTKGYVIVETNQASEKQETVSQKPVEKTVEEDKPVKTSTTKRKHSN